MEQAGQGGPVAVLEAGLDDSSAEWESVFLDLAQYTTVVRYDRAGVGKSEKSATPNDSEQVVRRLRDALTNAGLAGPYVLVGHSIGGLHARCFAYTYPTVTAGLVLVDPTPDGSAELQNYAVAPDEDEPEEDTGHEFTPAVRAACFRYSAAVKRHLGRRPLIVLTAGPGWVYTPDGRQRWITDAGYMAWREMHREMLGLSHRSRQIVAEGSKHYIHHDEPELVRRLFPIPNDIFPGQYAQSDKSPAAARHLSGTRGDPWRAVLCGPRSCARRVSSFLLPERLATCAKHAATTRVATTSRSKGKL
jgi:pimeloyl-ACP methyl ester carboxylesterase